MIAIDELCTSYEALEYAQSQMRQWRKWAKARKKARLAGKYHKECYSCGYTMVDKDGDPIETDEPQWKCIRCCAIDIESHPAIAAHRRKVAMQENVITKLEHNRDPELRKYVKDMIQKDGKLVYMCDSDRDGTTTLRRMRLREEDRPGAPEYVEVKLVKFTVEVGDEECDG